jgi:hypothetical protein
MFYTIYRITNKINGKIYVGKHQTKDLNDVYMGSGKNLRNAIKKYGIENFEKEILFQFDNEDDMNAKEAELVTEEFCLRKDTYNLCPGGKGGWGYLNNRYWDNDKRLELGKKGGFANFDNLSNNTKEKIKIGREKGSVAGGNKTKDLVLGIHLLNKKVQSGEIENPFKGKTHSNEWKKNHSELMKSLQAGEKNSQYGIPRSEETKNKMRESLKNKPIVKCSFCNFESNNLGIISRWHNENCKQKHC